MATAFFAHETIASEPDAERIQHEIWLTAKQKRTEALTLLKEVSRHTPEYKAYVIERDRADAAYDKLLDEMEKSKFGAYINFQQWLGEFGWAMGLFIYSMFNLIMSFIRKTRAHYGEITLHFTLISISVFFIHYTFQAHDFSSLKYILTNIAIALICATSAYLLAQSKIKHSRKLQKSLNTLSRFAMITVKKFISDEKMPDYKKESINVLKKGME